jgi:flagellar basal-body rod protein FlgF
LKWRGLNMDSGYYAACAGVISRTEALDTIANNLANVSTAGFRASHNIFSSMLATSNEAPLSVLNRDTNDYGVLGGTQLDVSQGPLVPTGNNLDMAIEGPAYFVAQTASGPVYTRGGNFHVSPQGKLVTEAGDPLMGDNGPIMIVGQPLSISSDGTISTNGAISGRLKLVDVAVSSDLKREGGTYYSAPIAGVVAAKNSQVRQGMLESSNVNPVTSVVELITAQREVEAMRRVLTMSSTELDKTAVQDIPRVS